MILISSAIAYLHSNGFVHGDLKQANILRLKDQRLVLADFGLTQPIEEGRRYRQPVSPAYSSPESEGLTFQNDVWSFGVIMFMNLTGYHPAALVVQYCLEKNIPYNSPHWGIFI